MYALLFSCRAKSPISDRASIEFQHLVSQWSRGAISGCGLAVAGSLGLSLRVPCNKRSASPKSLPVKTGDRLLRKGKMEAVTERS